MSNTFDDLLKGIDGIEFQKTDEQDLAGLKDLFSGKIPGMMLETFSEHVPAEDVEYGDFVFYGIKRIIEENTVLAGYQYILCTYYAVYVAKHDQSAS